MSHIYAVAQLEKTSALWPELATAQAEKMCAISQYWQPEKVDQLQQNTPTPLLMGQLLRFNTPFYRFEKVHSVIPGHLYVVANARLDNREQIFQLLDAAVDAEIADGMLIGLLYQRFNLECLQHLLGDFAFIIWDEAQRQLFAACDHFGVKNLFYGYCDLGLMVSNEHKALLMAPGLDNQINPDYLVKQWLPLPDVGYVSPCKGIKSIPPAHYLLVNHDGASCQRYWQLQQRDYPEFSNKVQSIAGLRQRFELAVQRRLVTDFTVGAELSEGLDSTSICGVAAKILATEELLTFSYRCEPINENNKETYRDILDFVEMYDNIRPQWREVEPKQSETELNRAIFNAFGAPMPQTGQWLERYPLITDTQVRTLLSGWGGDHCVTGYADFFEDELLKSAKLLTLLKLLKSKHRRGRGSQPIKVLLRLLLKHLSTAFYRRYLLCKDPLLKQYNLILQAQPLRSQWIHEDKIEQSKRIVLGRTELQSVQQRDWRELFDIGVHWRLFGSEVAGRFFQLEYRFPMLDKELVEYVYSMPSAYKIWNGVERSMFRDAISGLVTERIRTRLKSDVILPKGMLQSQLEHKKLQLEHLITELQHHPLTQYFFDEASFAAIPTNFASMPMVVTKLEALKALCKLYDQKLIFLPEFEENLPVLD
ncbi:asparagine synthase-related protein [Rheinheimera sp. UJ63]|uniref:asparagine synthase-related protein n=1 Tax=Rheinheimera sp. UJ63 TaxID=2910157 RepID=UPI001F3327B5|nr:asparagine synthase-related protein [Rheinheimera sp. UJ63]MCF4009296.1 asparagine synthase-related protein [Rheinheimera sp. UJ63]